MSAASYVGRIGGLAVALGVGAAVFTGGGIACAQPAASDSSSGSGTTGGSEKTSADTKTTPDAKTTDEPDADATTGKKRRHGILADILGGHRKDATPNPKPESDTSEAESTSDDSSDSPTESAGDTTEEDATPQTGRHRLRLKPAAPAPSAVAETKSSKVATDKVAEAPAKKAPLLSILNVAPKAATTTATLSTVAAKQDSLETTSTTVTTEPTEIATASTPLASLVKRLFDAFAGDSPSSPAAVSPMAWVVAAASRRELAAATATDRTMVWNGYQVVAVGEPTITSYYGQYTNVPAFGGVQGNQDFELVDQRTGETAATFHGLVTRNNDLGFGNKSVQIVVLDIDVADGYEIGTGVGDIPAVGSVFASSGNGRTGYVYSALAREGKDVISYKYVTPFGSIPQSSQYSSADFLTDYVGVNRPIYTADGYYVAPVEDDTMVFTGITGSPPLYTALQGTQRFGVFDKDTNELVGSFDGVVTVTSDFFGTTSEAILVTNAAGNVGTNPGQVPPEGTVYNVIYWEDETSYLLHTSKPSPAGTVSKTIQVTGNRVATLPIRFDAATAPDRDELKIPGKYTFIPTSEKIYTGINGLPPRESIVQGYQQFDVFDARGNYLGNIDATVASQWDLFGNSTEAILISDVNDFNTGIGTANGEVPPEGSVFNFQYIGTFGFGQAYYSLPSDSGNKVSFQAVTPFGGFPLFTTYDGARGFQNYDYYTPFGENNLNVLALDAGATLGLLGAV